MFATTESNPPILEARYIDCPHCGHQARTGLKPRNHAGQLTGESRCDCPKCGETAAIRSRVSDARILSVYRRMHLDLNPLQLLRLPRLRTPLVARWLHKNRAPLAAGLIAALVAAAATPAMADAVTIAMDREVAARTYHPAARDADGFCDARIRAYRYAPATDDVWTALEAQCPTRRAVISDLRQHLH